MDSDDNFKRADELINHDYIHTFKAPCATYYINLTMDIEEMNKVKNNEVCSNLYEVQLQPLIVAFYFTQVLLAKNYALKMMYHMALILL